MNSTVSKPCAFLVVLKSDWKCLDRKYHDGRSPLTTLLPSFDLTRVTIPNLSKPIKPLKPNERAYNLNALRQRRFRSRLKIPPNVIVTCTKLFYIKKKPVLLFSICFENILVKNIFYVLNCQKFKRDRVNIWVEKKGVLSSYLSAGFYYIRM